MSYERDNQRNVNHRTCLPRPQNTLGYLARNDADRDCTAADKDPQVAVGSLCPWSKVNQLPGGRDRTGPVLSTVKQLCNFVMQTAGPRTIHMFPSFFFFLNWYWFDLPSFIDSRQHTMVTWIVLKKIRIAPVLSMPFRQVPPGDGAPPRDDSPDGCT